MNEFVFALEHNGLTSLMLAHHMKTLKLCNKKPSYPSHKGNSEQEHYSTQDSSEEFAVRTQQIWILINDA